MAEIDDTSSTAGDADEAGGSPFTKMALDLNNFGALLNGVSEICRSENIGGDALHAAATICDQINNAICTMADRLDAMVEEGGAA